MDHDSLSLAPWSERSKLLDGEPLDAAAGIGQLRQVWGADRFLTALAPEELARLARFLHFVRLPADKEVISQNEQGDFMVVVLEGTVVVDRVSPQGGRTRLAEAHAGDVLGEMSLLDSGARFSSCTTATRCSLAVIDARGLDEMTTTEPRLGLAVMAALSRRLSLRLRQVSARLSALLSGH